MSIIVLTYYYDVIELLRVKNMSRKKQKNTGFKIAVAVLCILIIGISVFAAYLYINNTKLQQHSNSVEGDVARMNSEIGEYESALAEKQREAESYSRAADEQSAAFESEKNALNEKIADLNKQISLKHKREAEAAAAAAAATANGNLQPVAPSPSPVPAPGSGGKTVYLTFDDGPSPNTPRILDILDRYGVKATFFVINTKYNGYMGDIVNRGHAIGLHAYTHDYKRVYASDEAYYADLQKISDLVFSQTGVRSSIIRFPGGSSNKISRNYCSGIMSRVSRGVQEKGYQYYDWNCDSTDASGNNVAVETLVNHCMRVPKSSTVIVLMHDTSAKGTTVEALPQIIENYRSMGYSFSVISSATPPVHHGINN